jgi:hypothetical protein
LPVVAQLQHNLLLQHHLYILHTHTQTNTHTHINTYTHTYIHTYIHTSIHTYIHTQTNTHTHTQTYSLWVGLSCRMLRSCIMTSTSSSRVQSCPRNSACSRLVVSLPPSACAKLCRVPDVLVSSTRSQGRPPAAPHNAPAYVSIRQHTSAYVSIRQQTSAYVNTRQHTSANFSIHQQLAGKPPSCATKHASTSLEKQKT